MSDGSTIYALSSGRLPAAIAVIRISGSRAGEALKALTGRVPEPRKAALGRVRDPASGEMIDEALVLWFPGPNSETGEDTAELQLHGGRAVVAATFAALGRMEGLRPAEAGEFTRRSFENGKLDLTAVEGLADLVSAETEAQRRQAFRQMKGALAAQAEAWRERLIKALALVEARIDFSDEGDVPEDLIAPALAIARELADEIAAALADDRRGERLRDGLVVAIAGPPNAGKSTLLNRIARREAAIVSPYAGTTRDVIEVHLDLQGWPVTLLDTAGIRDTADPVEMEGVRRARERAAKADLVLWVEDAREAGTVGGSIAARPGPVLGGKDAGERGASGAAVAAKPDLMLRGDDAGEAGTSGAAVAAEADPARLVGEAGERDASGATVPAKADSVLDDASEPGAPSLAVQGAPGLASQGEPGFSPLVWRLRNKIDLLIDAGRKNEPVSGFGLNNESIINEMKPSFADVESRFVNKNESLFQKNELEFNISAASGFGLDRLFTELVRAAETFLAQAEPALITRDRHRRSLTHCLAALRRVISEFDGREEILGEELRSAAHALACLTGRVDVEDVLDVIFRDFCIGK